MALKDWGPLTSPKKQSAISAAFEAIKNEVDINDLDKVKQAVYNKLKETYKLNQAKFSTWEKFWANANYEKHLIYLESLVDMENEARVVANGAYTYKAKSGGSGSGSGNGTSEDAGLASGSGMPTLLIVGVVAVVVILLIKKFKKK